MLKDKIHEYRVQLQKELDQHIASANATRGAIQFADMLLSLPDEAPEPCPSEDCPAT